MVAKIVKTLLALVCAGALCASGIVVTEVEAVDDDRFNGQEDYYYNFCTNLNLSEEDQAICDDFYDYLTAKNNELEDELEAIKKDIANLKTNISNLTVKINSVSAQIRDKESQITSLEAAIEKVEANIAVLEQQIADREADIEARNETIMTRMEALQSIIRVNSYIDFIMGASDFVDLIRRVESVNDITEYDKEQIRELQEQKALLEKDKEELDTQKANLDTQKADLVTEKNRLLEIQSAQRQLIAEYNTQMAQAESMETSLAENIDEVKSALNDLSTIANLKPSAGWIRPVVKASISAGAFYYPASFCSAGANKCPHLGIDFAAGVGTDVVAPANAVVLYVYDGCPTYGGLGNYCGRPGSAGGGNQIYLAAEVNGRIYGIKLLHMKAGSIKANITWPSGDGKAVTVLQGTKLGEVGSSGNSSGPHTHVEIFDFGPSSSTSLIDVVNDFAEEPRFDFGLGFSSAGLSTTCSATGGKTPCRLNPSDVFGVYVGDSY